MHIMVRARVFLARHPLWYWLAVAALAVAVALIARDRFAAVDRTRDRWGTPVAVVVADVDHEPGDELRVSTVRLPSAAVPASALAELPPSPRLRQRVAAGEILVAADIATSDGPAARAAPGTVVVGLIDPTAPVAEIGIPVQVVAEGVVLAESGTIVELVEDVVYVAVEADRGAVVAAAAQQRLATLIFLP